MEFLILCYSIKGVTVVVISVSLHFQQFVVVTFNNYVTTGLNVGGKP